MNYRIIQKGDQFTVQHCIKILWIKLWLFQEVAFTWYLGVCYRMPVFASVEAAKEFIEILQKYPAQVKYKGFTLKRCWYETESVRKEPQYYHRIFSSYSAGDKFINYYPLQIDEYKKYIDEHLQKPKKRIIYP